MERTAKSVLAPLFCMQYINDAGYLSGDVAPGIVSRLCPTQKNISFMQMLSAKNQSNASLYSIIAIKALKTLIGARNTTKI